MNPRNDAFGIVWLCNLVLMTSAFGQAPGQGPGHEVTGYEQALNDRLADITSLHARFEQSTTGRNQEIAHESGELWVQKPDHFRIVTGEPNAQTLVSDGKSFWSYDVELEQVIIRRLDKSIRDVPILLFGGDPDAITRQYRVSFYESDQGDHYVLEPKTTTSVFTRLTIMFQDDLPSAIAIRDNFGQQILMELIEPAVNVDLKPELFTFTPPNGVDVIDDRQSS